MNVEINDTMTLRGCNKAEVLVDTSKWSPEFVQYLISYGWDVRMQRCTAGAKDTDEFQKKESAMLASMIAGELPHKGGGGLSTSLDDKIATRFLTLMGVKGKISDLDERWLAFSRVTVLNSIEDKAEKAAVLKNPAQLTALAVEYMEAVKVSAASTPEWAKIKAELEGPKVAAPKLAIKISLK